MTPKYYLKMSNSEMTVTFNFKVFLVALMQLSVDKNHQGYENTKQLSFYNLNTLITRTNQLECKWYNKRRSA